MRRQEQTNRPRQLVEFVQCWRTTVNATDSDAESLWKSKDYYLQTHVKGALYKDWYNEWLGLKKHQLYTNSEMISRCNKFQNEFKLEKCYYDDKFINFILLEIMELYDMKMLDNALEKYFKMITEPARQRSLVNLEACGINCCPQFTLKDPRDFSLITKRYLILRLAFESILIHAAMAQRGTFIPGKRSNNHSILPSSILNIEHGDEYSKFQVLKCIEITMKSNLSIVKLTPDKPIGLNCPLERIKGFIADRVCNSQNIPNDGSPITFFWNHDVLCTVADFFKDRSLSLVAVEVHEDGLNVDNMLTVDELVKCYNWGDQFIRRLGNPAYHIVKQWEGWLRGHLIQKGDGVNIFNREFRQTVFEGLLKEIKKHFMANLHPVNYGEMVKMTKDMDEFFSKITSLNKLSIAFGIFRQWSHPVVNGRLGINRLRELGRKNCKNNDELVQNITGHAKRVFCMNYFARHKIWPKCQLSDELKDRELYKAIEDQREVNWTSPDYYVTDWSKLKFLKTFNPEATLTFMQMLEDKAVSSTRNNLKRSIQSCKLLESSKKRRAVLKFMQSKDNDAAKFLKDIDEKGFDEDDLIFSLMCKEREMKIVPRMIPMATENVRKYFVLTEKLISDYIMKYFPQSTMMLTGERLFKKRMQLSDLLANNYREANSFTALLSIDFEKWNSHMRHAVVQPLFQIFDDLLGYKNLIGNTHKIISDSILYLNDKSADVYSVLKEEWIEQDTIRNHQGGLEGQRQKGWTIFTSMLIDYVLKEIDLPGGIMGMGDNQMVWFSFPKRNVKDTLDSDDKILWNYVEKQVRKFVNFLREVCQQINLPIKVEETTITFNYSEYGKEMIVGGEVLSQALKKLCRISPLNTDDRHSLASAFNTISASSALAAPYLDTIHGTYFMTQIEYAYALYVFTYSNIQLGEMFVHPFISRSSDIMGKYINQLFDGTYSINEKGEKYLFEENECKTKKFLEGARLFKQNLTGTVMDCLSLFGSSIGGLPILTPYDLIVRANADPVTKDLTFLKEAVQLYMEIGCNSHLWNMLHRVSTIVLSGNIDVNDLLLDPECINVFRYVKDVDTLRKMLRLQVEKEENGNNSGYKNKSKNKSNFSVANPDIKQVFNEAKYNRKSIIESISKFEPFNPRSMAEIFKCTQTSIADTIVGKFTHNVTVQELAPNNQLAIEVRKTEFDTFLYLVFKLFLVDVTPVNICSCHYAQLLRCIGWNLPTICGISSPSFSEVFDVRFVKKPRKNEQYFSITVEENLTHSQFFTSRTTRLPMLGSVTRHDTMPSKYINIGDYHTLKQSVEELRKNISNLKNRQDKNEIRKFFEALHAQITNQKVEETEEEHESMNERLLSSTTQHHGFINTNSRCMRHFHISTNGMTTLTKSTTNMNAHLKNFLIFSQYYIVNHLWWERKIPDNRTFYFIRKCKDCLWIENSENVTKCTPSIQSSPNYVEEKYNNKENIFKPIPQNDYLYLNQMKIGKRQDFSMELVHFNINTISEENQRTALSYTTGFNGAVKLTKQRRDLNLVIVKFPLNWCDVIDVESLIDGYLKGCMSQLCITLFTRSNDEKFSKSQFFTELYEFIEHDRMNYENNLIKFIFEEHSWPIMVNKYQSLVFNLVGDDQKDWMNKTIRRIFNYEINQFCLKKKEKNPFHYLYLDSHLKISVNDSITLLINSFLNQLSMMEEEQAADIFDDIRLVRQRLLQKKNENVNIEEILNDILSTQSEENNLIFHSIKDGVYYYTGPHRIDKCLKRLSVVEVEEIKMKLEIERLPKEPSLNLQILSINQTVDENSFKKIDENIIKEEINYSYYEFFKNFSQFQQCFMSVYYLMNEIRRHVIVDKSKNYQIISLNDRTGLIATYGQWWNIDSYYHQMVRIRDQYDFDTNHIPSTSEIFSKLFNLPSMPVSQFGMSVDDYFRRAFWDEMDCYFSPENCIIINYDFFSLDNIDECETMLRNFSIVQNEQTHLVIRIFGKNFKEIQKLISLIYRYYKKFQIFLDIVNSGDKLHCFIDIERIHWEEEENLNEGKEFVWKDEFTSFFQGNNVEIFQSIIDLLKSEVGWLSFLENGVVNLNEKKEKNELVKGKIDYYWLLFNDIHSIYTTHFYNHLVQNYSFHFSQWMKQKKFLDVNRRCEIIIRFLLMKMKVRNFDYLQIDQFFRKHDTFLLCVCEKGGKKMKLRAISAFFIDNRLVDQDVVRQFEGDYEYFYIVYHITKETLANHLTNQYRFLAPFLKTTINFEELSERMNWMSNGIGDLSRKLFSSTKLWSKSSMDRKLIADDEDLTIDIID
ncbi:hypothetical protein SNEBB_005650 [Seison nebaliae]|nr:hypothetical protein SNEBB_005650 [Seison nebaliae]